MLLHREQVKEFSGGRFSVKYNFAKKTSFFNDVFMSKKNKKPNKYKN
tara:strand:- start:1761 stop:1901 length:141 start_codon:yes stop_codon:yes gene_type:complete